jgi:hypothetical protein
MLWLRTRGAHHDPKTSAMKDEIKTLIQELLCENVRLEDALVDERAHEFVDAYAERMN